MVVLVRDMVVTCKTDVPMPAFGIFVA